MHLRGALIGFGVIASGHRKAYAADPTLDLVAVVDRNPARRVAATAAGLRAYATYEECIRAEALDFIDICTPPTSHSYYLRKGIGDGLDILCEKPVFLIEEDDFPALGRLIATAAGTVYPIHNYKFSPIVRQMCEIVREPAFGEVVSAHFRTLRIGHARGIGDWNPDWRRQPRYSAGGILRDHGPHSLYLAEMLTGRLPTAVSCITGRLRGGPEFPGTEDTALVRIRCGTSSEVVLDVSWAAAERSTRYTVTGTGATVMVEDNRLSILRGGRREEKNIASDFQDPTHASWFSSVLADFLVVRADPERQRNLLAEAFRNALVIEAAYRSSAEQGAWVELPDFDSALSAWTAEHGSLGVAGV